MTGVDPIAFTMGNFVVRWYGILIAFALIIGIVLSYFIAKYRMGDRPRIFKAPDGTEISRGKEADEVINFAPFAVIFGVIGARLLHVVVNWSYYAANPSYIFAFRQGGLAIQGVMLGGVLALAVFCKIRKIDFWLWADIIAPALVLGQAIGRWGNYFNQEAFGMPTSLPWGIYIDPIYRPVEYSNSEFFHPTFFYEFLANLILCGLLILLHRLYKKRPDKFPAGLIFATYIGVYAVYRSIIEFYRIDSSYFMGVKVVYILDFLAIIAALIIANYLVKRFRNKKAQEEIEKIDE